MLDGLRGYAIILVVLSHLWTLYVLPEDAPYALEVLFESGDFAVSIFFVIGAYLATSAMLRQVDETGHLRFGVVILRRWVRLSAQVYPLVIAVLTLTAIDPGMQAYARFNTTESAWRLLTYTWPSYMENHTLEARPDLGNLWYVAADLWGIALIAVLVSILRRHRVALFVTLCVVVTIVMAYRHHTYVTHGEFIALIQVACRIDGLIWGAIAATAAPWTRRLVGRPTAVAGVALLLLIPLMFSVHDLEAYFGFPGLLLNINLAVLVSTVVMAAPPRLLRAGVDRRTLRFLGRHSFAVYLWHYPVFWYVAQNYVDWTPAAKIAVGLAITALISMIVTLTCERPAQRWLRSPAWRALDDGIPKALWRQARAWVRKTWHRDGSPVTRTTVAPERPPPVQPATSGGKGDIQPGPFEEL
jgi:peptidoglycan/LPS O-acetylase OafA/YrhL